MKRIFPFLLLLAGCIPTTIKRLDFDGYHVLAVKGNHSTSLVNSHCHKYAKTWDDGTLIDCTQIWACYRKVSGNRKGVIVISERHIGCLAHEVAHVENPDRPAWVEKNYPCIGD